MKKWKYRIEDGWTGRTQAKQLVELGIQGWELVAVYSNFMYFKREIEV